MSAAHSAAEAITAPARQHAKASPTGAGPLDDIVVADFSRVLAGPYATMMLADMGATIIKVEGPTGDDTRKWAPPSFQDQASYYQAVNRNKSSIVLDFADADDLATAKEIAARADVFIHNFKPGSLEKFGLGYEDVRALRPDTVYAHISGFGSQGGGSLPGYDVLIQGFSGFMDMCGDPEGAPTRSGVSLFDISTGMMTAYGILAAIRHRDRTGQGQLVENNLMANAIFTMANQYQVVATTDELPSRQGKEHATLYPYNAFPTADGDLIVVAANDGQFARLAAVLDAPEWLEDERFDSPGKRNLNRRALAPLINVKLAADTRANWFAKLRAAGLPCAPVQNVAEGLAFADELGLDPLWTAGEEGTIPTVRNALRMSATPPTYRKEPPALGEDSQAVRAWLAGEGQLGGAGGGPSAQG
ncbi:CoA transferase [Brevibacterium sp. 5221]|uniref:CoA transferase n=1 Tax=Brevibacterium rongguiense TaxID=2695267 RepID=A0A6N9H742_9MICO|nr:MULTISPECIES: CoA transferase [Brevibacterium]MYM19362.1 CoA transferase [Brevibacterium rongguiense]WAL39342.1 CoA transferase [Brevibacterium sp. BRM-1]